MKAEDVNSGQAMKEVQEFFKRRGSKALELAKQEVLREKVESKQARKALSYFMNEYWHDFARPSLLSLVCEAVGGDPDSTTPIAIPMTLISGAIDIHDDIIDQSRIKNGKPTVYGRYGKDIALLVGDALLFKGLTLLGEAAWRGIPGEKLKVIIDLIKNTFFELGDAEALELLFRSNLNVTPEEYLRVVRKKAADVEAHTRAGAILGDASSKRVEALGEYGRLLGMLIILRDDWIDIFDLEESRNRIKKESLPLPILYGLQDPGIREKVRAFLLKKTITKRDAETLLKTIQKTNVPQKYARLMRELATDALLNLRKQKIKDKHLEQIIKATLL